MARSLLFWFGIVLLVAACLFPILWMLNLSLKPNELAQAWPPVFFFFEPTFEHYPTAWRSANLGPLLLNSVIVAVGSTILVLLVSVPAAYSFARYETSRGHLLFMILSTRMMPAAAIVVPYYLIFRQLGLLNTHMGVILAHAFFNFSFCTFVLYGFFKEIDPNIEYSAMIDGYSRPEIFRRIIFPLLKPPIAVVTSFSLMFSWNEFLFAFVLTRTDASRTVTAGIEQFWTMTGIQWGPMSAAALIAIAPMLVFSVYLQKYIVRGLTFGAVKR